MQVRRLERFLKIHERDERIRSLKRGIDLKIEFSKPKGFQPENGQGCKIDWDDPPDFESSGVTTCGFGIPADQAARALNDLIRAWRES